MYRHMCTKIKRTLIIFVKISFMFEKESCSNVYSYFSKTDSEHAFRERANTEHTPTRIF